MRPSNVQRRGRARMHEHPSQRGSWAAGDASRASSSMRLGMARAARCGGRRAGMGASGDGLVASAVRVVALWVRSERARRPRSLWARWVVGLGHGEKVSNGR